MKRLDEIGMSDKDRMSDALASQKFITCLYNTGANECEHMELKSDIMGILHEEHQIQQDIFDDMKKRGWYESREADPEKLEQAREDFRSIGSAMEEIADQEMKEASVRLHATAGKILAYLEANPEKIMAARRFIDYYQDTASKLLNRYVELEESGLGTDEIKRLKGQTKQALLSLNQAFEGQFEKLMENELMDMDVEIRVLKQTMEMEGYEEKNS